MGCKCGNPTKDNITEFKPETIISNNFDTETFKKKEEDKDNQEYLEYPREIVRIINEIRQNPQEYAKIIEDSIKNIIIETNGETNKKKIIYKDIIKVELNRGEDAFMEAAEILQNMLPLPPLEFREDICIDLSDLDGQKKDSKYIKEILSKNGHIKVFFREMVKIPEVSALLMIVDDNKGKNKGKKRKALLNDNLKYIGVTCNFIGKTFMAYFSFSK